MLARPVTTVVFVPGEVISQGSPEQSGLTAEERPVSFGIWFSILQSAIETMSSGNGRSGTW
jgi:hypothetical protein